MKTTYKIVAAYVAGQATQLIIHTVALNLWAQRQIPFCAAGGFIIFFALLTGVWISSAQGEKAAHEKTYLDYAAIPTKPDRAERVKEKTPEPPDDIDLELDIFGKTAG